MVKKTLIAIALVAFLASTAPAKIEVYYFGPRDKDYMIKSDHSYPATWPFEYKALDVCSMPVKIDVGMYIEVSNCSDKKIELKQVQCSDIELGGNDFPCYWDCESFSVRANFEVQLGYRLEKNDLGGQFIEKWDAYYESGETIPGDGDWHDAKICVRAWKTKLWDAPVGDKKVIGKLFITAKPVLVEDEAWVVK